MVGVPRCARAGEGNMGRAGLPAWLRTRVARHPDFHDAAVPSAEVAADLGGLVSERTVRRYRARYALCASVARREGRSGRAPLVDGSVERLLREILAWGPDLYLDELVALLNAAGGASRSCTRRQVVEALRRMRFVRVQKERRNMAARYEEQRAWFSTPPVGPPRVRGVRGVPTAAMVDIDETVVRLGGTRRTMARTLRGTRALCREVTDYTGVAYTVILATDINVGVVAYQILSGTVNRDRYLLFLYLVLFPRLGGSPRYLLMDNASPHHGAAILETCEAQGHTVLYRPAYSPHLAWIEQQNGLLKGELRRRHASPTNENIVDEIERVILECITPEKVRAAAAHCHYPVPGYPCSPWLGD
jgi:transposase